MENSALDQSESAFVAGLDLSAAFFQQLVQPIVEQELSGTKYSAALIGNGSEVLGFDTTMSTDHCWGPRLLLFLPEEAYTSKKDALLSSLAQKLPAEFMGYPTKFAAPEIDETGIAPNYSITVHSLESFFAHHLGFDIREPILTLDWLSFPEQKLATITAGRVFHDELELQVLQERFSYYPHDLWLYLLACAWTRIEQEEHLMGRAGIVGDEIGSALIAARLVRDLMRLCFLMEKQYAPYPKWFGTAFSKLKAADSLEPILKLILSSAEWRERQRWLSQAYKIVAGLHNSLAITEPLNSKPIQFHERPFLVISMGAFSKSIFAKIQDPDLKKLMSKPAIGSVDLFSDNTDLLSNSSWRPALLHLYKTMD